MALQFKDAHTCRGCASRSETRDDEKYHDASNALWIRHRLSSDSLLCLHDRSDHNVERQNKCELNRDHLDVVPRRRLIARSDIPAQIDEKGCVPLQTHIQSDFR